MYLWFFARDTYAAETAEVLGVTDLVAGYFSKRGEPLVGVDFAVDDDPCFTGWSRGGHPVEPFGGDPHDEELLKVPAAVAASGS